MPIPVHCPGCNARLNAPDSAAGRNVKCPKCQALMTIPAKQADPNDVEFVDEPAPKKSVAPPRKPAPVPVPTKRPAVKKDIVVDDDEDDDRPRKRRRDDDEDDDDDRPRKKKGKKKAAGPPPGLLIGGGIAAVLLLGGVSFAIYWFAIREKPKDTAAAAGTTDSGPKAGPPSGWVQFTPATGGFQAYFPKAVNTQFQPKPPAAPVRSTTSLRYSAGSENPMMRVEVQVIYFPPEMSDADKDAHLFKELDPSQGEKAAMGLKETSSGATTLGGVKGTQKTFELNVAEMLAKIPAGKGPRPSEKLPNTIHAVARGVRSGDRGYIAVLITGDNRSSDEKAFFDNFEIVPETASAAPAPGPGPGPGRPKK